MGNKLLEGYLKVCRYITNETWRETQLELIYKAFILFLSSKSLTYPLACPQCGHPKPSLSHRFWQCPPISVFWDQIINFVLGVTSPCISKHLFYCYLATMWPSTLTQANQATVFHSRYIFIFWLPGKPSFLKTPLTVMTVKKRTLYREKLNTESQNYTPHRKVFMRWCSYIEYTFPPLKIMLLMSSFQYMDWYLKASLTQIEDLSSLICIFQPSYSFCMHLHSYCQTCVPWDRPS